jgi:hypothetical protein
MCPGMLTGKTLESVGPWSTFSYWRFKWHPCSVPFVVYTSKMSLGPFFCAKSTGLGSVYKTCWRKPSCWILKMVMRTCHFSGAGVSPYPHIAVCLCRYACAHKEMVYSPANSASYTYTTQNVRLGSQAFSFCTNDTLYARVYAYIHTYIHTKFRLWFMYRPHQSVLCTSYRLDIHGIAVWFLRGTKDFFLSQNFQARCSAAHPPQSSSVIKH